MAQRDLREIPVSHSWGCISLWRWFVLPCFPRRKNEDIPTASVAGHVRQERLQSSRERHCLPTGCQDTSPLMFQCTPCFVCKCCLEKRLFGRELHWWLCQQQLAAGSCLAWRCARSSPEQSGLFLKPALTADTWLNSTVQASSRLVGEEWCQSDLWPLWGVGGHVAPCSGPFTSPKSSVFLALNSSAVLVIL